MSVFVFDGETNCKVLPPFYVLFLVCCECSVNFKKNDNALNKDSDVLKMVQEMDRAPKTPPVACNAGTNSVYCATLTPSEMIGTPEIPVQGASFKILERFLSGEDERGSSKSRLPLLL